MTEVLNKKYTPPDNSEGEKQQEAERKSQEYLKLAKENPHKLTEEIKKNPQTEPLLRQILGDAEYERIKDLNPNKLSEDTGIAKMQGEIYSFVDINPETDRNPTKDKFIKGLIDSIIVGNAELAMKIIETKGAILKNMIQEIFSWEGLKNIAEGFGKSVMELFSGDAYKTGKSLGELGLITVGSGAGGFVLKRLGKGAIGDLEGIKPFSKEKQPNVYESIKASEKPKILYEDPSYVFLASEKYQKFREAFPNLSQNDIIGEGNNAIILQHPNKGNRILKVAKEGVRDNIIQEFNNHQRFYETLEQGRVDFPGQLSENVKIPQVRKGNGDNPIYFEMEKIDGQSFKSLFYREKYATQLEKVYSKDNLAKMSDAKLEGVVKELGLDPIPSVILNSDGGFSKALFSESQTFMWNRIRNPIGKQEYELGNTLSFLDWKGLRHTDMHSGNFMLSRDGKTTYIIDFGNTNLNIKK